MLETKLSVLNGNIATEPYVRPEAKVVNGWSRSNLGTKDKLVDLKVLIGNDKIPAGCVVYVRPDIHNQPWVNKIYTLNDLEFILVPDNQVILVEK